MPIVFEMPALSPTMEKGNLVTWCKKEGDEIAIGDVIVEIDTDKATMEVESIYKGTLAKILIPEGTHEVAVKTPIALIKQKGDTENDIEIAIKNLEQQSFVTTNQHKKEEHAQLPLCTKDTEERNTDKTISPLAKRLANENNIDISAINGTGPHGRIIKRDIQNAKNLSKEIKLTNETRYLEKPATTIQLVIAEKLTKVKQEVPHFYMSKTINVTKLQKLRQEINESQILETKVTVTDLLVKAIALAIKEMPSINSMWHNGNIRQFNMVDISIAVATNDGIMTPIIFDADKKNISQISTEIKNLAKKAKENKLKPEEYNGGCITISNLGMYGIDTFYSIINPPQASILSIGTTKKEPIVSDCGTIEIADIMQIGYAVDHRVISGATAAQFLSNVSIFLETPIKIII